MHGQADQICSEEVFYIMYKARRCYTTEVSKTVVYIFIPSRLEYYISREGTPILGHGTKVPRWSPPVLIFSIRLGHYFMSHHDLLDPLFLQKSRLSLSHLVLEILGPNIGKIFHPNVLLNSFYAFCITFDLDIRFNWPTFSLILNF